MSRRRFLAGAAAAAVPVIIPSKALGADGALAPSERVAVGVIGNGPQATGLMKHALGIKQARVVAVCDVNRLRREAAAETVNAEYGDTGCAAYNDFRDLLARPDIDAVIIGSPDHWHVLHGIYAARAGKDMYIEKPLALALDWAYALRDNVNRYGRVFQFGTQQRSSREFRFACELVANKRIGDLKRIRVGAPASSPTGGITPGPVPEWLDYDLWLGPAPWAPFSEQRIVNSYWWHNSNYALGFVAGWGVHHVDIAQWGNGADATGPVEVEGTGVFPTKGFADCATKWNVFMKYANGVVLDYTDDGQNAHGIRFEGDAGWVHVARGFIDAEPKALLETRFRPDAIRLYESRSHVGNFIECVKTRGLTACPIETTVRTETICHLSDIAMRLKRKLHWDPAKEAFAGDDEANRMLTRAMREPWRL